MNTVGEKLEKMGYELQAINSQLKRHPQFVLFKKGEPTIFVLVKTYSNLQNPNEYDVVWMEAFKEQSYNVVFYDFTVSIFNNNL